MRILLPSASYPPLGKGGGPKSTELIARGLVERGHTVRVLTAADEESLEVRDGVDVKLIGSPNVHWNYWEKNPAWRKIAWHVLENYNPRAYARARDEIADFAPDIVMTISIENVNVATWKAARDQGVPVAHMLYSYFLTCWRGSMFRDGKNCDGPCADCKTMSVGKKRMSRYVDGVTAESDYTLRAHTDLGYFPGAIARVVPGGIEHGGSPPRVLGAGERIKVGFIGLHSRNKGIEVLGRAADRLLDAPIEYLIAGDGDAAYTDELRALFPSDRTTFLGWSAPDAFFQQVDFVVVPSLWNEPFGRVRVEPLTHGVPVAMSRSGGLAEHMPDGEASYSFPPGDDAALAEILQRFAADRDHLNRLGENARRAAERFRYPVVAEGIEGFLTDVIAHAQARRAA